MVTVKVNKLRVTEVVMTDVEAVLWHWLLIQMDDDNLVMNSIDYLKPFIDNHPYTPSTVSQAFRKLCQKGLIKRIEARTRLYIVCAAKPMEVYI